MLERKKKLRYVLLVEDHKKKKGFFEFLGKMKKGTTVLGFEV